MKAAPFSFDMAGTRTQYIVIEVPYFIPAFRDAWQWNERERNAFRDEELSKTTTDTERLGAERKHREVIAYFDGEIPAIADDIKELRAEINRLSLKIDAAFDRPANLMANDLLSENVAAKVDQNARLLADVACDPRAKPREARAEDEGAPSKSEYAGAAAPIITATKEIDLKQKSLETVWANDLLSGKAGLKIDQNTRSLAVAACDARVTPRTEVADSVRSLECVWKGKEIDLKQKSLETVQMANDLLSGNALTKVDQNSRLHADAACDARVKSRADVSDSARSFGENKGYVVDVDEESAAGGSRASEPLIPQFCVAYDPTYTRRYGNAVHPGCSFCYEHLMADEGDL